MYTVKSIAPRTLVAGEIYSFYARAGERLLCRQGRLLVTLEGVLEDFELSTEAALPLRCPGKVVVEAFDGAVIERRFVPPIWGNWWALAREWVRANIALSVRPCD